MINPNPMPSPFISRAQFAAFLLLAVVLTVLVWIGSDYAASVRNPRWSRVVILNGETLGSVELRPLELKNGLWSLSVYFHPARGELGIVREHRLRWWQIADRDGRAGYPRMDLQRGSALPGSPGDDDDPAYYTLNEKLGLGGHFSPDEIFADNKYWMRDSPQPEDGVVFETWLVQQDEFAVTRLVGFRWGIDAERGNIKGLIEPAFIDRSSYNFPAVIEQSGFGSDWVDQTPAHPADING